ncbi:hypothetical protein K3495_g6518 [Podosphaera aphanis]|nr:hypothetical protein K3495_g6518 [Podosphaera aphanis]
MASEQGTSNLASSATLSTIPIVQQTDADTIRNRSLKRARRDNSHDSLSFIANPGLVGLPSPKSPRFHSTISSKFTSGHLSAPDQHKIEERETSTSEYSRNDGDVVLSSILPVGDCSTEKSQKSPAVSNAISIADSMSFGDKLGSGIASTTNPGTNLAVATASVMSDDTLEQENGNVRPGNVGYSQAPPKELISRRSINSPDNIVKQAQDMNPPMLDQQLSPRSSAQKKHECPYCETAFTRYHNLKSHLLTHSQEKPYVCQTCSMRFRRLHDLKRHTKLHTGERPHVCLKCNRKFARSDALARHIKGQGGCAGRRSSIGSFGADDEFEDQNTAGNEEETALNNKKHLKIKSQINYQNNIVEKRQKFILSLQAQQSSSSSNGNSCVPSQPSNTYPPCGSQPRQPSSEGTLHHPPGTLGDPGYLINPHLSENTSRGYSPTVNMSNRLSNPENNSPFPQSTINKNSSSLNPAITHQSNHESSSITRHRSPVLPGKLQSHHYGGQQPIEFSPSDGTLTASQRPKLPVLTSLTPPDQRFMLVSQGSQSNQCIEPKATEASSTSAIFSPEAQLDTTHPNHQNPSSTESTDNNLFSSGEKGVWAYVQTLEERVKELSDKVQSMESIEKAKENKISQLSAEILSLRSQIDTTTSPPQSEGSG